MWIASLRVNDCQRRIATSTYFGSISRAQARRPTRSAAKIVVPEPEKVSSTRSPRLVQSLMASATMATGFTVG